MPSTIDLDQADPVVGAVAEEVPSFSADELFHSRGDRLVSAVRTACTETGFFYIDVTSSQRETLAATLVQMDRFFALKDDDPGKQNALQKDGDYGWVPKYSEPAYQPGTVSSLEAFDFGLNNVSGADTSIWPQLPDFRAVLTDCWRDYLTLGDAILEVIARAAGLDPDFLIQRCNSRALNTMRLLHYASEPAAREDDEVGIAAHTDFECITLLYQTAPGLELLNTNDEWLDAPVREGQIVVLLDDMLEHWTNGVFKATGHRVRNTERQRYSIVLFVAANDHIEIAPLPLFVRPDEPSRYTPITQAQHIEDEVQRAEKNAASRNVNA